MCAKIKFMMAVSLVIMIFNIEQNQVQINAVSDVGICDVITANGNRSDKCDEGQVTFINPSFEEPADNQSFANYHQDRVPGWSTTNSRKLIEVWNNDFAIRMSGTPCQDGVKCSEINATESAALYQDFDVTPGQTIYYSFYHKARDVDGETLDLRMGKPNDAPGNKLNPTTGDVNDIVLTSSAKVGVWTKRIGKYVVPSNYGADGSSKMRIAFLSTTNSSLGNLIDNVEFYTEAVYDNIVELAIPSGGVNSPDTDIFHVSNKLKYFNRDMLLSSQSSVKYTLSSELEFVEGSLYVEDTQHSNYNIIGNEVIVSNLPEIYDDIDIRFDTKLKSPVNSATIEVSSYFEYASNITASYFPDTYETHFIEDTSNVNISYYPDGYCDQITANAGYSTDCSVDSNIVYDNEVTATALDSTVNLENKVYNVVNTLRNINTDISMDPTTSSLTYEYSNNVDIDYSTLKINGVLHTEYNNTSISNKKILKLLNLPNIGTDDYVITFSLKYNFSPFLTRDVFNDKIKLVSKLTYENQSTSSFVNDEMETNTSFATNISGTTSISDASLNSLLEVGENINGTFSFTNNSPIAINNAEVELVTDTKLQDSIFNVVVVANGTTLLNGVDYTIQGSQIFINSLAPKQNTTITYSIKSSATFDNSKPLLNIVSVSGDKYSAGYYLQQKMEIDVYNSSSYDLSVKVSDSNNGFVGINEALNYTVNIMNDGNYELHDLELANLINSMDITTTLENVSIVNKSTSEILSPNLYNYSVANNSLKINYNLLPKHSLELKFTVKSKSSLSNEVELKNDFKLSGLTLDNKLMIPISKSAAIPISKRPVVEIAPFIEINVGDTFNIMDYVKVNDAEDGVITTKISYSPPYNNSRVNIKLLKVSATDSDNRTSSKDFVLLVNDGNVIVGENKLLYATDFSKYVNQVVVSNDAVIIDSKAVVYDKYTATASSDAINVNLGGYTDKAGTYPITLSVSTEQATSKQIIATVKKGNPPIINGVDFVEVKVGDSFNPLLGVSATDDFDGDITSKVIVTSSVNVNVAGVYKLTYSVTDKDKNTTTATRIVLVNDGNFDAGKNYILYAKDFTKRVSEVNTSNLAIQNSSNSRVYDIKTGEIVNVALKINKGSYTNVVGKYNINITTVDASTVERVITANVISGNSPVLNVSAFDEIPVGGSINLANGISAMDAEDGNISSSIVYTGKVNTKQAGVYRVVYSVQDNDRNTVQKVRVVLVNDGNYDVGSSHILHAKNFYKLLGNVDTSDNVVKTDAKVVLYNKNTGLISSDNIVVNLNGYSNVVGTYPVSFTVGDVTNEILADVSTGYDPEIILEKFIDLDINSTFDPLYGVSAFDIEDGNITNKLVVTSNNVNTSVAGVYYTDYEVTDLQGNTTTARSIVLINDGTYHVGEKEIFHAKDFSILVSDVDTSKTGILEDASVKYYSKETGEPLDESTIIVDSTGYTNVVGVYDIIFKSTISEGTYSIQAIVNAGNVPKLSVEKFIEIPVGSEFDPSLYATAEDEEDGDVSGFISHNHGVDTSIHGFYNITYYIKDFDGNIAIEKSIVLVNDGDYAVGNAYVIYGNDYSLRVSEVDTDLATIKDQSNGKVYSKMTGQEKQVEVLMDLGDYDAVPGKYSLHFTISIDSAVNKEIIATVVGGESPIIDGPTFTEVPVGTPIEIIFSQMSVNDLEDGNITSKLIATGSGDSNIPGIYEVKYSVTDSDMNTTSYSRIFVVNDGRYLVTDNYVIEALDFTKRISLVDISDEAIIDDSNFHIYSKIDGSEVDNVEFYVESDGYHADEGSYEIIFYVIDDGVTYDKEIIARVIAGSSPTINGVNYVELDIGDDYNFLGNIRADDVEDGNITDKIKYTSNLDTSKSGVYTVKYSVVDLDNNVSTMVVTVVVGPHATGDYVVVFTDEFTKRVSEVDTSNEAILQDSNYRVYLKSTGEEVSDLATITITTDYTNQVGEYLVTFIIEEDPSANAFTTAYVIPGEKPKITAENVTVISVGDNFSLLDNVFANDEEDGDLTSIISVEGYVDPNIHGVYKFIYNVMDSDNNQTTISRVIVVDDGYYEVFDDYIIHKKDYTINAKDVIVNKEEVIKRSELDVYNIDGTRISTEKISINFKGYEAKEGKYEIIFTIDENKFSGSFVATVISEDTVLNPDELVSTGLSNYNQIVLLIVILLLAIIRKHFVKSSNKK